MCDCKGGREGRSCAEARGALEDAEIAYLEAVNARREGAPRVVFTMAALGARATEEDVACVSLDASAAGRRRVAIAWAEHVRPVHRTVRHTVQVAAWMESDAGRARRLAYARAVRGLARARRAYTCGTDVGGDAMTPRVEVADAYCAAWSAGWYAQAAEHAECLVRRYALDAVRHAGGRRRCSQDEAAKWARLADLCRERSRDTLAVKEVTHAVD